MPQGVADYFKFTEGDPLMVNFVKLGQEALKFAEPVAKATAQFGLGLLFVTAGATVIKQGRRGIRYLYTGALDEPTTTTKTRVRRRKKRVSKKTD